MDPGASSSAGLWAARAPPAAAWRPPPPLTDGRNNARPSCPFPYMRRNADAFAKATVDRVFAAVPGLNKNELRERFAGPPGSTWKPPPLPDPPVRAQEEARMGQAHQHPHQAAQQAQMEAYVRAQQNPPVRAQPLLSPDMMRLPAPSPEWAPAWAQAQAHEEARKAARKAGEDAYARALALNGWPP
jgi:hypothetical protein